MTRAIKPKSSYANLAFNPGKQNVSSTTNIVRVVQATTNTTNEITNKVEFDGDMKGGTITNVDSISMAVFDIVVTESSNLSLQEHLEGTSIVQISLFVDNGLVRRQSYFCTSESESNKVFVLMADTDTNHSSQITAYSTGIIGISTFGQETAVKIARLSLV